MLDLTVRLLSSLAVVIGLVLVLARLARRRGTGGASAPLRVVHRQPLSRSTAVAVVEVGGRTLVLGTTEHQISLLTELDPESLVAPAKVAKPARPSRSSRTSDPVPSAERPSRRTSRKARRAGVALAPVAVSHVAPVAPVTPAPAAAPAAARVAAPAPVRPAVPAFVATPVPPALPADFAATFDAALARLQPLPALQEVDVPSTPASLLFDDLDRAGVDAGPALGEPAPHGALHGSILSPSTWRQAMTVAMGRA